MSPSPQQLPTPVRQHLRKRGLHGPWTLEGNDRRDFDGVVVIPALAENRSLPATLESLAQNPEELRRRFLILAVINHGREASVPDQEDNAETLRNLRKRDFYSDTLELAWVDAASPGRELPGKGGVGSARKIGFDLALQHCRYDRPEPPLLISLDADTLVEENYLSTIANHFRTHSAGCAVLPYRHRPGATSGIDTAIQHYELFLRSYVLGLGQAGSPYAFHTIGSAIACRADAYIRGGGMNRRPSGEDFYFLQQMQKTTGVAFLRGTTVHPSPRPSLRVPFGTGPTVARFLQQPHEAVRFYHPGCFTILRNWLSCVVANWQESETVLFGNARDISPHLAEFLERIRFSANWKKLQVNHRTQSHFQAAFHGWFDGLRTRQLLHTLSSGPFPSCNHCQALEPLFEQSGLPFSNLPEEQLQVLRSFQPGKNMSAKGLAQFAESSH
jgi:hypothetical protein